MSPSYQFFPCQTPSTCVKPPPGHLRILCLMSLSPFPAFLSRLLYPPLPSCWIYVEEISVLDAGLGSALGLCVLVKKSR